MVASSTIHKVLTSYMLPVMLVGAAVGVYSILVASKCITVIEHSRGAVCAREVRPVIQGLTLTQWKNADGKAVIDFTIEGARVKIAGRRLGPWQLGVVPEPVIEEARITFYNEGSPQAVLTADRLVPAVRLSTPTRYETILAARTMKCMGRCSVTTADHVRLHSDHLVWNVTDGTIVATGQCTIDRGGTCERRGGFKGSVFLD